MEAPTVGLPLKYENNKELTLDEKINIKFSFNDKNILINIIQNEFTPKEYEVLLSLEQLNKINKFFTNFEKISEIIDWLINSIEKKVSNINFNDGKCFIQIINPINQKQFELTLNLKAKDLNARITDLESIIIKQNNKIKELEDKIKEYEPMFEEYKNKEKKISMLFNKSDILDSEEKILLLKWLPNKPKKTTLLLNSKIDGDSCKTFIQKVQNKCPTLVIIETIKGRKFGGYTTQIWKKGETSDNDAFVFSLVTNKKYEIVEPQHAIGFDNNYWLFGWNNNAIVVKDHCKTRNDNYVCNKTYKIEEKYELNGGEEYFIVSNFEVYFIEY